jgi:hypothetical protein
MGYELLLPWTELLVDMRNEVPLPRWIRNFDAEFYRTHGHFHGVADLAHLSGDELLKHFVEQGWMERRSYNRFFYSFIDPEYYSHKYSDLEFSHFGEAISHWMYFGVYENKIPNVVTQALFDAPVHLFQMGKVGSKSIEMALRDAGHDHLIPHLHWANEMIQSYPDCFYSYEEMLALPRSKPLKFISGIRDPIERVVSGLFESAESAKSSLEIGELNDLVDSGAEALSRFVANAVDPVLRWFDHRYFCDLDVYDQSFNVAQGYGLIEGAAASVFLYRVDKLADCWAPLGEFVGLPLNPTSTNESEKKEYSSLYKKALSQVRFSREFMEYVLGSRYCQTFFDESERKAMGKRFLA